MPGIFTGRFKWFSRNSGEMVNVRTLRAQGQCFEFAKEWMKGTHVVVSLSSSRMSLWTHSTLSPHLNHHHHILNDAIGFRVFLSYIPNVIFLMQVIWNPSHWGWARVFVVVREHLHCWLQLNVEGERRFRKMLQSYLQVIHSTSVSLPFPQPFHPYRVRKSLE